MKARECAKATVPCAHLWSHMTTTVDKTHWPFAAFFQAAMLVKFSDNSVVGENKVSSRVDKPHKLGVDAEMIAYFEGEVSNARLRMFPHKRIRVAIPLSLNLD